MVPKLSRWKAQHAQCQTAVDNLKEDYEAEVARLEALVRDAASWIEDACREHPNLEMLDWVVALRREVST